VLLFESEEMPIFVSMKRHFSSSPTSARLVYSLLLCLILVLPKSIYSQNRPLSLELSYLGNNFWNPGLKASLDAGIYTAAIITSKEKTRSLQKSHRLDIGFFADPGSYRGLFINAGWQRKTIYPNRFFISWAANPIGLFRSFLHETYEVSPDGEISKVTLPGRLYLAPSFQTSLGRVSKKHPDRSCFARLNMILLIPYNTFIMPLLNVEVGCTFPLEWSDN